MELYYSSRFFPSVRTWSLILHLYFQLISSWKTSVFSTVRSGEKLQKTLMDGVIDRKNYHQILQSIPKITKKEVTSFVYSIFFCTRLETRKDASEKKARAYAANFFLSSWLFQKIISKSMFRYIMHYLIYSLRQKVYWDPTFMVNFNFIIPNQVEKYGIVVIYGFIPSSCKSHNTNFIVILWWSQVKRQDLMSMLQKIIHIQTGICVWVKLFHGLFHPLTWIWAWVHLPILKLKGFTL